MHGKEDTVKEKKEADKRLLDHDDTRQVPG
jgi:hypothetical protein